MFCSLQAARPNHGLPIAGNLDVVYDDDRAEVYRRNITPHAAMVGVVGRLTPLTTAEAVDLVCEAASEPTVKVVIVALASWGGELIGHLAHLPSLELAHRKASVVSYLCLGAGPALWLAYKFASRVYAPPTARIGFLSAAYRSIDSPEHGAADPMLTETVADRLAQVRPQGDPQLWRRLASTTINGEQAEAAGVVDRLAANQFSIAADYIPR